MKKIVSLLCALLLVASCQKSDDLVQDNVIEGSFASTIEDIDVSVIGDQFTFAFTSITDWSITNIPSWITLSKRSGKPGTTNITVQVSLNDERKTRTADMKITNGGTLLNTLTVNQDYPYLRINDYVGDTIKHVFLWDGKAIKDEIKSNVEWEISTYGGTDIDMFELSDVAGQNDHGIELKPVGSNYSTADYDLVYKVTPMMTKNGMRSAIPAKAASPLFIKLHQNHLVFLVNGRTDAQIFRVNELNDDGVKSFNVNAEVEWAVQTKPDWVSIEQHEQTSLTVSVNGPNPTLEAREGIIRLGTDVGAFRDITVSQSGYVFDVEDSPVYMENEDEREYRFRIVTTGTWEIRNIPSWLEVTPSNCTQTSTKTGQTNHYVTVRSKGQNLKFEDVRATLNICSTLNELKAGKEVNLEKFNFSLDAEEVLGRIPTMDTGTHNVYINVSGEWYLTGGNDDWFNVDRKSSMTKGPSTIRINAVEPNPDQDSDRETVYYLHSTRHENMGVEYTPLQLKVVHRKFVFTVTPNTVWSSPAYPVAENVRKVYVDCSGSWRVYQRSSWINVSPSGGDGSQLVTVTLTPEPNIESLIQDGSFLKYKDRSGYVTFVSDFKMTDMPIVIDVNQAGFQFDRAEIHADTPFSEITGQTQSVDIVCDGPWSIVNCPDWVVFSNTSGNDSQTLTYNVKDNPNKTSRSATVYLRSNLYKSGDINLSKFSKTINVAQKPFVFDETSESLSFKAVTKDSKSVNVSSSGSWTVKSVPAWIRPSVTSGHGAEGGGSEMVSFIVDNNTTTSSRSAVLVIAPDINPSIQKQITISQEEYRFAVASNSFVLDPVLDADRNTVKIEVTECSGSWRATTDYDWVKLSDTNIHNGAGYVTATIANNPYDGARSALITLVNMENSELNKAVYITQRKFVFDVTGEREYHIDASGKTISVGVECSGQWSVSSDQDWVTVSKESNSVTMSVSENLTKDERRAVISISNDVSSDVVTITIIQNPKA